MTNSCFYYNGSPVASVSLYEQLEDGNYGLDRTVFIPRRKGQTRMQARTIIRLVDERIAELDGYSKFY